ncbi:hypothetical protein KJ940_11615, partial [Myxococcota bacterium]|nr:hypothetical protein [Myxococcota bacterium]
MGWFYRFELKAIQGFIFAGRRLREVVGASALIELLSDGGLREIAAQYNGTVRYRAAGGATLHFNDKIGLEGFAARWPMEVATFAPGVVLTQAWVEDSTPQPISALARKLGAHRNLAPPAMPSATPVIERSPYGALATNKANDEGQFIDQATRAKEIAQAKSWNPKHPTLADELSRRFVGDDEARLAKLPRELTEITGHDGYYLAVIHADGNDVGRLVQGMGGDIETMAAFSEKLSHATEAAARTASLKHLFDDDSAYALGRPIVVGGDDITAVVRADRALPFLETYCAAFAEETRSAGLNNGKGLTASAGVAFVRAGHPFRDGYRLAEGLCEHAKKVGRGEEGEGSPALVAFHRVSASLA